MAPASKRTVSKARVKVFKGLSGDKGNGFRDGVPMETSSSEDSSNSLDSLASGKKDAGRHSKYVTVETLRQIFLEDTESDSDIFEGFTENEMHMNGRMESMSMESDRSNEDGNSGASDSEKEDSLKKKGFGLRVALKFPAKKSARKPPAKKRQDSNSAVVEETVKKSSMLQEKKNPGKTKRDTLESDEESDEEDEGKKENSRALLRRSMNIKENKEMLAKLLAELNSMPELFPMKQSNATSPKQKKTPRRSFSEGPVERRMNPSRSARPPEKFALENFALSAVKLSEQLHMMRRKSTGRKSFREEGHRRPYMHSAVRSVDDVTEEELENVAVTVKDKIYDKIMGSTCHQCRQKTIDTKTICRNPGCGGVRGQFCGPCLRNRYGEDVRTVLLDPDWICPPCRGICNCSFCRKRDGRCATGMLIHLAKFYGYDNVKEYLESLQKQLEEEH